MTSNSSRGFVSVVIPCFNRRDHVAAAILSVLQQSLRGSQIIVVDDGSSDRSDELVRAEFGDKVILVTQENRGAAAARNAGARVAGGNWILFLDADDWIEARFLEGLVTATNEGETDLALGRFALIWPSGRTLDGRQTIASLDTDARIARILTDGWMPLHAILWRKRFFWDIGGWDESLSMNDDGELLARAMLRNPALAVSELDRAIYVQHDNARISGRRDRQALESRLRVLESIHRALGARVAKPILHDALSSASFELALRLHSERQRDLAARAEAIWRTLGPPYMRTGSYLNRVGTAFLGLNMKANVARWMRAASFSKLAS